MARFHAKVETHCHKGRQHFGTEDICDVFPGRKVGFGGEDNCLPAFGHDITDNKLDLGADASIRLKDPKDFAIFSLDVLFELTPANWKVEEEVLYNNSGAFLASHSRGSLQLARRFKIKPCPFGSLIYLCSSDRELGKSA